MKVKKLIEKLKEFNPEAEVLMECGDGCPSFELPVEVISQKEDYVLFEQY